MDTEFFHIALLFYGFMPLIGLFLFPFILGFIYSLLICSVEQVFADNDNNAVPKRSRKVKWHLNSNDLISNITLALSLKEHSPPNSLITSY